MSFPVVVESHEGQFRASLVGDPSLCVAAPSREAAVAALKDQLRERVAQGQLLSVDVDSENVWGLAGRFADDPTLRDLCAEAYAARNAEFAQ